MSAVTTATPATGRPRRRLHLIPRTRKGRVTAAVLLLLGVPALAYAVYLFLLGITGSVSSTSVDYYWNSAGSASAVPSYATCTAVLNDPDDLGVTATGLYPGDSCQLNPTVGAGTGSTDGVVTGVANPAGMPDGWTIDLAPAQCGKSITESGSTTVSLLVALDPSAPAGSGGALPAGVGLEIVPADQYTPALCP